MKHTHLLPAAQHNHISAAPPSPPSRQAQNHPSRHQAWTRIRSVTPRKKVRWGGIEVMGDDGYVGSEER
ncbi:hypothetical protein HBI49_128160 [Parastagonospora nodorum]|nr:hypothetical protein HBI49_128160 [Parastagonospora nodorum]KAH5648658.1 hypothetical protein HBI51_098480 [Parastagonospora nodorum]KAH5993711.1 hypothetical protein HBI84_147160 [Parastagonospora nodorum]KAH6251701.1 hypothetical protein HBI41_196500 [Parastagonospora nodorum]KAH6276836.1 hypothetical protein HBI40_189380 [Parastagonospora nodorum]